MNSVFKCTVEGYGAAWKDSGGQGPLPVCEPTHFVIRLSSPNSYRRTVYVQTFPNRQHHRRATNDGQSSWPSYTVLILSKSLRKMCHAFRLLFTILTILLYPKTKNYFDFSINIILHV